MRPIKPTSKRYLKRSRRAGAIFRRKPSTTNAQLGRQLGLSPDTTQHVLVFMKKYLPEEHRRRAITSVTYVGQRGRRVRRFLTPGEIAGIDEMLVAAVKEGVPLGKISASFPALTPRRLSRRLYVLRQRGLLPKDTRLAPKGARPVALIDAQLAIMAHYMLSGRTNLMEIRQALNRQKYRVGGRVFKAPVSKRRVGDLKVTLRRRIEAALRRAAPTLDAEGNLVWDVGSQVRLGTALELTDASLAKLGEIISPKKKGAGR